VIRGTLNITDITYLPEQSHEQDLKPDPCS